MCVYDDATTAAFGVITGNQGRNPERFPTVNVSKNVQHIAPERREIFDTLQGRSAFFTQGVPRYGVVVLGCAKTTAR